MRTGLPALIGLLAALSLASCQGDEPPAIPESAIDQARHELTPVLRRDTQGLAVTTRADGSQHLGLDGRFATATVVRRNADGTTTTACVEEVEEAAQFLAGAGGPTKETH